MCSSAPWNKYGMMDLHRESSTELNSYLIPWVACCTNSHSCWRDFYRPVYAACIFQRAIPASVSAAPSQNHNFLSIQVAYAPASTKKKPK